MEKIGKIYLDAEKNLFNQLPSKEKEKRIREMGSEVGAIQQYGYELAMRSMDTKDNILSAEEKEQFEKLKVGAENVIKSFSLKRSPDNKKGENLLIITDSGADKLMIKALWDAGKKRLVMIVGLLWHQKQNMLPRVLAEQLVKKMKMADAILLITSLSRTHAKETADVLHPHHNTEIIRGLLNSPALKDVFSNLKRYSPEELADILEKKKFDEISIFPSKARIISIINTNREILTKGAALEDPVEMVKRIDKFAEAMEGVEKVKITSENGTNLELDIKVPSLMKENGIIDRPGMGSNFPTGEYDGAVDLAETNGVYVIDGAIGMIGKPDKPIKLTIEKGKVTKIEGGESAKKLQAILEETNKKYREKNPDDKTTDAFKLAEFSFGMNSKAFRYSEDGRRISPPTSLEAEKGLGTIHIALGKNSIFNIEKDDPDYNDIPIHIDCVAMNTNVSGIKENSKEIEIIKNGEVICL